ncbi:DUF934 domain-containing protein [Ferruginivarius sediminum]|uniref:DUF934 domain-containing protein n=1 Tax=Ferruginivarius sediminum TaxID=2661937 RepID=A0A369TC79_9PROT|nr:DUF934 domain-containing protein [Ferruginivarius sediminum]RDD62933.1 DUF934 domain-containing protein [Ferruginivarius sediminum]
MPLLKHEAVVDDPWIAADTLDDLPAEAPAIVPLELWREHGESLRGRNAPLGIRLKSDQFPTEIADDLDRFDLVALEFPKFSDGRPFTSARLLRQRYHFKGELRAVGQVKRDQALFMVRCGFDAFEVDEATANAWGDALNRISVAYQPASDARAPVTSLRHHRLAAE